MSGDLNLIVALLSSLSKCEELEKLIQEYEYSPAYKVLNRLAVERRWKELKKENKLFVFFDIDKLHCLNETLGYDETNRRIAIALSSFRSIELLGLVFSGDEFVMVVPGNEAEVAIARLRDEMRSQGITVTVGVVPIFSEDFDLHWKEASKLVQISKKNQCRDRVLWKSSIG
jgi:GGDEF domain-containing protein